MIRRMASAATKIAHVIKQYQTLVAALVGSLVVIYGWPVAHKQNLERDLEAKKWDILIEVYRRVEGVANRSLGEGPMAEDLQRAHRFEDALGDIQLLGSKEQVQLAVGVVQTMVSSPNAEADMNPLLISLRRDLRRELQLPQVDENLVHLRIRQKPSEGP